MRMRGSSRELFGAIFRISTWITKKIWCEKKIEIKKVIKLNSYKHTESKNVQWIFRSAANFIDYKLQLELKWKTKYVFYFSFRATIPTVWIVSVGLCEHMKYIDVKWNIYLKKLFLEFFHCVFSCFIFQLKHTT